MKRQDVAIDINRLTTEQLGQLADMFYCMGQMDKVKQVNDRIAYVVGWMDDDAEREYFKKWCAQ